mgnify:CR=1 FL=1
MTPFSTTTQYWPCRPTVDPLTVRLPRNTEIFHNTTPNKLYLQRYTPEGILAQHHDPSLDVGVMACIHEETTFVVPTRLDCQTANHRIYNYTTLALHCQVAPHSGVEPLSLD